MCYALTLPFFCALQSVTRVFITALFAAEDLIRLVIHTIHSYLSSILQLFSFVPICCAVCFAKKCFCNGRSSSGCYPKPTTSCSCTIVIILTIVAVIILYYTFWIEDLLGQIKIKLPCVIFRKTRNKEATAMRKYENKKNSAEELNTSHRYKDFVDREENQEWFSGKPNENSGYNSSGFTKIEYVMPEHRSVQTTTESDVDYFNLALRDIGNETELIELIKLNEGTDEIGWNNLTNYRTALRL